MLYYCLGNHDCSTEIEAGAALHQAANCPSLLSPPRQPVISQPIAFLPCHSDLVSRWLDEGTAQTLFLGLQVVNPQSASQSSTYSPDQTLFGFRILIWLFHKSRRSRSRLSRCSWIDHCVRAERSSVPSLMAPSRSVAKCNI